MSTKEKIKSKECKTDSTWWKSTKTVIEFRLHNIDMDLIITRRRMERLLLRQRSLLSDKQKVKKQLDNINE